ncbi:hypothetical protein BH11VER1_BH11VER1_07070 [soil metagenome]
MHPSFKLLSALALAAASLSSCQTAAPNRFDTADLDKDGKLSAEEVSDFYVVSVFETRDANKDGKMTLEEWVVAGDKVQTANFKKRDTNKDGVVTRAEAMSYAKKHDSLKAVFTEADTNKDGSVSREEAKAFYGKNEGPLN